MTYDPNEYLVDYYDALTGTTTVLATEPTPERAGDTTARRVTVTEPGKSVYAHVPGLGRTLVARRCNICGQLRPVVDLVRHAQCRDRVGYQCRTCHSRPVAERRRTTITIDEPAPALTPDQVAAAKTAIAGLRQLLGAGA